MRDSMPPLIPLITMDDTLYALSDNIRRLYVVSGLWQSYLLIRLAHGLREEYSCDSPMHTVGSDTATQLAQHKLVQCTLQ